MMIQDEYWPAPHSVYDFDDQRLLLDFPAGVQQTWREDHTNGSRAS